MVVWDKKTMLISLFVHNEQKGAAMVLANREQWSGETTNFLRISQVDFTVHLI